MMKMLYATSDTRSDITERKTMRDSCGFVLRVVTESGVVFRGDIGFGKERVCPEIFIGYPLVI